MKSIAKTSRHHHQRRRLLRQLIKTSPTTIPGILSGLKSTLLMKSVTLDHGMLKAMKAAVSRLPYTPRNRLPCTYSMVLHIIDQHTQPGFTIAHLMLAVGVAMAYHLCLRASEYASRTEVPDPESHQFDSKSVEFKFFDNNILVPSSNLLSTNWHNLDVIRFTIQHAINIKKGHDVPIWFSTQDPYEDAVAFLRLVYLWVCTSNRQPDDPFLSYRSSDEQLHCLVYETVHTVIARYASDFGLDPQWFKPHSIRMSAPTVLRVAGGDDGETSPIRWKQVYSLSGDRNKSQHP